MRCFLLLLLIAVAGADATALVFDGSATEIPTTEWQWLDEQQLPEIATVAQNLDRFLWIPLSGPGTENTVDADSINGTDTRLLRLNLTLSYTGPQHPLLVIPFGFTHELRVGVVFLGAVTFWQSVLSHGEAITPAPGAPSAGSSFATVVLPLHQPGDYQVLIKTTRDESTAITGNAHLFLDQDFFHAAAAPDGPNSAKRSVSSWTIFTALAIVLAVGCSAWFFLQRRRA